MESGKYVLIGGSKVNLFSSMLEKGDYGISQVLGVVDIPDFIKKHKNNPERFHGFSKIIIIDTGTSLASGADGVTSAKTDFLMLESYCKNLPNFDMFLVMYTLSPQLESAISGHHNRDRLSKYLGTKIIFEASHSYTLGNLASIMKTPYKEILNQGSGDVELQTSSALMAKLERQKALYTLLGQREEVTEIINYFNKRRDMIDAQIKNYVISEGDTDIEVMDGLLDRGEVKSLNDEISDLLSM